MPITGIEKRRRPSDQPAPAGLSARQRPAARTTGRLSGRQLPSRSARRRRACSAACSGPSVARSNARNWLLAESQARQAHHSNGQPRPAPRTPRRPTARAPAWRPFVDASGPRRPAPEYSGSRPASPCYPCQASGAALVSGGADAIHLHLKVTRLPGSRKASRNGSAGLQVGRFRRPDWQLELATRPGCK